MEENTLPYNNFGHRLYYKGIKIKEDVNRKTLEFKRNQLLSEKKELPFKPTIITKQSSLARNKLPLEEYLQQKGK